MFIKLYISFSHRSHDAFHAFVQPMNDDPFVTDFAAHIQTVQLNIMDHVNA